MSHSMSDEVQISVPTEASIASPERRPQVYATNGQKERRKPSITPRKFTRFFTPRSVQSSNIGSTRRSLFDASASQINRNGTRSSPIRPSRGQENNTSPFGREFKRRKLVQLVEEDSCFERSMTPCIAPAPFTGVELNHKDPVSSSQISVDSAIDMFHEEEFEEEEEIASIQLPSERIQRIDDRGLSGRLLHLNLGSNSRSNKQRHVYPVADYQDDTSRFYSHPQDVHSCTQPRPGINACIPFCTAACNTNSLVAIGDERGRIRLIESSKELNKDFNDVWLSFQAHNNAIIDMSFSQDDSLLATGSGDQRVRVIDMKTQQPVCEFEDKHTASVKVVKFQPGQANNSVLASCSRDGNVHIYDMRCRTNAVVARIAVTDTEEESITLPQSRTVNTIADAHQLNSIAYSSRPSSNSAADRRPVPPHRRTLARNDVNEAISVTSIAFLPTGREHLLLSASEYDSSVKLWDVRAIPRKNQIATALAQTKCPESQNGYRQVGLTSLAVSADGSRFYAAARDNAVYVYSTPHLMLGHASELNIKNHPRQTVHTQTRIDPMYAFRHPMLLIGSFYIKLALRPARHGLCEMLAVGSTDSCTVLFPTDERHLASTQPDLHRYYDKSSLSRDGQFDAKRARIVRSEKAREREEGKLKVSERGTALIEGHQREVSSVAWNSEGALVGVSDDALVRIWREGRDGEARSLRQAGNENGRRWNCGWADVSEAYDETEGDE